jgi:hypothetical protein
MKSSSQDEVLISDILMWCVENPENSQNPDGVNVLVV